jgi:AcrR family transcriptional regulator
MSGESRRYQLKARAEKLAETRQRIVEAAAGLHVEVGPAQTTVAEIARRAGVRRATVYNHFPDETELFAACGAHSLATNPPPDPSAALALEDPAERLRVALTGWYGWYRKRGRGIENLQRDRFLVPALDAAMAMRMDPPIAGLVTALAAGFAAEGETAKSVRAMVALAIDFWTWRRLSGQDLSDDDAAAVMVGAVRAAAGRCAEWR